MSTAQHTPSQGPKSIKTLRDEMQKWLQEASLAVSSSPAHPDDQEIWNKTRQDIIAHIRALDFPSDKMTVIEQPRRTISSLHCNPPVLLELDQTSNKVLRTEAPHSDQEVQIDTGRPADMQHLVPSASLQLPPSSHRKQYSMSSTGTGCYTEVTDRELDLAEMPASLRFFAVRQGQTDGTGVRFHGTHDTGHTGSAPLLSEKVAEELGWLRPATVENHTPKAINGTDVQILGQVISEVDFLNDNGKAFLKKTITWHVVPDGYLEGDCLINLRLCLLFSRLRSVIEDKIRSIPKSSRRSSWGGNLGHNPHL